MKQRNYYLENTKLIMALLVVAIHVDIIIQTFIGNGNPFSNAINYGTVMVVPFFLIAQGYYWKGSKKSFVNVLKLLIIGIVYYNIFKILFSFLPYSDSIVVGYYVLWYLRTVPFLMLISFKNKIKYPLFLISYVAYLFVSLNNIKYDYNQMNVVMNFLVVGYAFYFGMILQDLKKITISNVMSKILIGIVIIGTLVNVFFHLFSTFLYGFILASVLFIAIINLQAGRKYFISKYYGHIFIIHPPIISFMIYLLVLAYPIYGTMYNQYSLVFTAFSYLSVLMIVAFIIAVFQVVSNTFYRKIKH